MISTEVLAITYGLSSALTWGAGDFSGGVATKRGNVFSVILFSQVFGAIFLVGLALLFAEKIPRPDQLLWGGLAGMSGALGLIALYKGLAQERMGIVAPLSAVIMAILPILFAAMTQGLPQISQLSGFGLAIFAVWFLSCDDSGAGIRFREIWLAVGSGFGFALFFIFINRASSDAILWPLVAARLASLTMMAVLSFTRGQTGIPGKRLFPVIALAGILDATGNAFFVLSAQLGRLDISAVLASLAPGTTVVLAWLILKERLRPRQWLGVGAALLALVLISV
ncbi:EamA/RhaT family transporter [Desulfonema ishimotonii]|uniref:EamA/RhaT family transporter n=1 Tax=Desulfonema ishimotonii TaxID=45657 RepID=A0A401G385_9BACT|nr:DMT family transporter [Desulfonema ishimotonii]GBC63653.1 EamA/RhaT family transporter [Desulfonema ishimotonii]